jgi:putative transposase
MRWTSERQAILDLLHSERFVDRSPFQVWATLLEEDEKYLCSPRTMYRILAAAKEVRERRNQRRRPHYTKPELMATTPNQVWTWDLTKLRGPEKWMYYHLYLVLDLFSRMIAALLQPRRRSGSFTLISASSVRSPGPGSLRR